MAKSPDSGGGDRAHAGHVAMIGDALGLAAEQGAPEPHGAQHRRRAQYGEAEAAVVGPRMGREAQRAPRKLKIGPFCSAAVTPSVSPSPDSTMRLGARPR